MEVERHKTTCDLHGRGLSGGPPSTVRWRHTPHRRPSRANCLPPCPACGSPRWTRFVAYASHTEDATLDPDTSEWVLASRDPAPPDGWFECADCGESAAEEPAVAEALDPALDEPAVARD